MKINIILRYSDQFCERFHGIEIDSCSHVSKLRTIASNEFKIKEKIVELYLDNVILEDSILQDLPIVDGSEIKVLNKFVEILKKLRLENDAKLRDNIVGILRDTTFETDDLQSLLELLEIIDNDYLEKLFIDVSQKFCESNNARLLLVIYNLILMNVHERSSSAKLVGTAFKEKSEFFLNLLEELKQR